MLSSHLSATVTALVPGRKPDRRAGLRFVGGRAGRLWVLLCTKSIFEQGLGDLDRTGNGFQVSQSVLLQLAEERATDGVLGFPDLGVSWAEFHEWTVHSWSGIGRVIVANDRHSDHRCIERVAALSVGIPRDGRTRTGLSGGVRGGRNPPADPNRHFIRKDIPNLDLALRHNLSTQSAFVKQTA